MAQTMLGSPIYMAPEILRQEIYTSKADIWSLGVVLFEMLFGYCPFESNSINQLINVLQANELTIPSDINPVSEATRELLRKMLIKDQFKRIQWVDLFEYRVDEEGRLVCPSKKDYSSFESLENYFLFNGGGGSDAPVVSQIDIKMEKETIRTLEMSDKNSKTGSNKYIEDFGSSNQSNNNGNNIYATQNSGSRKAIENFSATSPSQSPSTPQ